MSINHKLDDFPDVEAKLQKPSKQSAFEKQKAEAEAKRKREAAETAAVYESFVKSFDNDDDDDDDDARMLSRSKTQSNAPFGRSSGLPPQFGAGGGLGKRHFGAASLKSGPGSLGPVPTAFGKKKYDTFQQGPGRKGYEEERGRLGFNDDSSEGGVASKSKSVSRAFDTSDDEADTRSRDLSEEKAVARPTLRLSDLPPGTSPAVVKALIPKNLVVENARILPSTNTGGGERKAMTAIVTLSTETPAAEIDAAVSALQNRYLGYGFYLSLHRHLSSAVSSAAASTPASTSTSHAFGAKPVPKTNESGPYQPGGFHRGFAPPPSYSLGSGSISKTILHVPVRAPGDIKQIQLIHKVVESILEYGPEFEALLMTRPDVQKEEKWAWIWDARSEGGVWYRWRLWEVVTGGHENTGRQGKYIPLFEGSHAWKTPEKPLTYEYTTALDEFVSDPEYNSSDDEELEDEGNKPADGGDNGKAYLNPLEKAKLTHLLARLPTTLSKIRKGDIARVTSFAITHSSQGADEIVETIVSNIVKPLALTSANPDHIRNVGDDEPTHGSLNSTPLPEEVAGKNNESQDTSPASLIGLYVVSDILSSSATSGVRHAWRYRQLFETSLRHANVFENLGLLAERLNWGRLRAEKWRRSVGMVLGLWESWCAFPNDAQQFFTQTFENPPSAKKEELPEGPKKGGKWKTVEAGSSTTNDNKGFLPVPTNSGIEPSDGEAAVADLDGEEMDEGMDMDVDLDSDIDGVPMDDDDTTLPEQAAVTTADTTTAGTTAGITTGSNEAGPAKHASKPANDGILLSKQPRQSRRRMRAMDMFADSDDTDEGK
ncbi:hypothetical protein GGS21DRAFT_35409 [Xylaria nigripes]|nr:hypothetical protein GGS21DRAFT_35409 [Xylaria nigripes]